MDPEKRSGWRTRTHPGQEQIHRDRLHQALSAGGLGLWEIDLDTMVLHRAAPSIPSSSSLLGADMEMADFLDMVLPEYREDVSTAIDHAMKQAQSTEVLYRIRRPDQAIRWIEAHISPVLSTTGDVLRLIAVTRDVTLLRQAEIEREALLAEMAAARQAAERSVRQRDAFITSSVHDLRTPLTYIRGRAQLLQRKLNLSDISPENQEWLNEGLNQIAIGVAQMTDLLVDLQDVIFLQLGQRLDLHPAQVDVVAFTRGIVGEFETLAPDHHFAFTSSQERVNLEVDPVRVRRVISNLLQNAVKYSNPGTTITCTIETTENDVVISFRDEGFGIPPNELESIFTRYQRGSNVSAKHEGSGIGLAGARMIIRQHGGELSVESALGSGSTFRIRLPYTMAQSPA